MRGQPGWVRICRALNHGRAREACRKVADMRSSRTEIQEFASHFAELQDLRHRADYDPVATFRKSDVLHLIAGARAVLERFERADRRDRRTFATVVLFANGTDPAGAKRPLSSPRRMASAGLSSNRNHRPERTVCPRIPAPWAH